MTDDHVPSAATWAAQAVKDPVRETNLSMLSSLAMLRLYAEILTTLKARGVVRSRNAPAGDLSEYLTAAVYRGALASQSKASWDVEAPDGLRLQVKSRVLEPGRPSGNYSPFRSWDFDAGVFVHFDADSYQVIDAFEVPVAAIRALTTVDTHVGTTARRLTVSNLLKARDAATFAASGGQISSWADKLEEFRTQMTLLDTPQPQA